MPSAGARTHEGTAILGVRHSRPELEVPRGACDCHTHVFGPARRFPFWSGRTYTPADAPVEDLARHQAALGLERVVIVQPSPYHTDNACTLAALAHLGARARGIAVIDPGTPDVELSSMHSAGVRGVRLNLETSGMRDPAVAREALGRLAERVAPLGWHIQIFAALELIAALRRRIGELGVRVVIDHFGLATGEGGLAQPGFGDLVGLVAGGRAYVKLSAAHRIAAEPDAGDVAPMARALIAANPERVLWGSDWPHPSVHRSSDPTLVEPFDPIDDGVALGRLGQWAPSEKELRLVLVDNPARLYGFTT